MTEKKMTQKEALGYVLENCEIPEKVSDKLKAMIAQIEKKSASGSGKLTKGQEANAEFKMAIIEEMTANPNKIYTITDLIKSIDVLSEYRDGEGNPISNQKVSALVSQLVKDGKVERITEKRRSYFKIVIE